MKKLADTARILVASDVVSDAELVRKLLRDEFEKISLSTDADRSVEDFERFKPDVLVLAFNSLEKAERYYLGLYRLSTAVHGLPHRTVILCNKDDLKRVYELCKREYFDDYILFWPLTHDAPRLPMAVFHALRQMNVERSMPASMTQLAAQARRIAELESALAQYMARGHDRVDTVHRTLRDAEHHIGAALEEFSRSLSQSSSVEVKDRARFEQAFDQLRIRYIEPELKNATDAVEPVRAWAGDFAHALSPQIESARSLQKLAEQFRPVVLIVDDDEFQRRLLGEFLSAENLQPLFAASGIEAIGILRKHRPDIILMDFDLPGLNGVEATRRIRSVEQFADIPVLIITGHSERNIVIESRNAGASGFVVKPVDKVRLLDKIQRTLQTASERRSATP
ncbi:response regulator [Methyloversatilis sp.]|uniref:response regulator n=1 Tax=Methyloversatilis sp. TaxID=2569862 RepID=UPI002734103E|nr:response regulator [Methyloversatilis sp.]MDP2868791.1 response regulator [Methyloversatilis sp.]MDP3287699.1 response regulator [Methyloversatilis sp.]MDP3454905.1 response regulator [Methyloversatilis sp.]MDP3577957.1 response regulator [Methyloversatilis sp.]